jgi:hypothetical protein
VGCITWPLVPLMARRCYEQANTWHDRHMRRLPPLAATRDTGMGCSHGHGLLCRKEHQGHHVVALAFVPELCLSAGRTAGAARGVAGLARASSWGSE